MNALQRVAARAVQFVRSRTSITNPDRWLLEAMGVRSTTSGVSVNERTAMEYASAYACINVCSKDIAQLPVFVYRRKDNDERETDREHAVWRVMHDRPNPLMTPFSFKQTLQSHAMAWGNAYAEIELDGAGRVVHLWPLLPDRTSVEVRNGRKWIITRVREENGTSRDVALPPDRILHIPGLGFDGITGYSVIRMAANAIGAGLAAEEYTARMFSNGASVRLALKTDRKLSPEARTNLKASWDAAYAGLSNAHRTAILEEGLTVEKLGLPAKDQELIESGKFSIEQMARFFDIPLMRLHSTTAITSWGTGLEQWQRAYLTHTLGPWLVQWEESLNDALFSARERAFVYVEFLREALLQADTEARGQFYTNLFGLGAITPNQIARKQNMPGFGTEGDKRYLSVNYVPVELAGQKQAQPEPNKPSPPDAKKVRDAHCRVVRQVVDRIVTKHAQRTRKAAKRLATDAPDFLKWVREFYAEESGAMRAALEPALMAYGVTTGRVADDTRLTALLDGLVTEAMRDLTSCTTPDQVEALVTRWEHERAAALTNQLMELPDAA